MAAGPIQYKFTQTEESLQASLTSLSSEQDVDIVCGRDGRVIPASSLVLALSSQFMARLLSAVLGTMSRLDTEKIVIHLPDFNSIEVTGVLQCMTAGQSTSESKETFSNMETLLVLLQLNKHEDQLAVKVENIEVCPVDVPKPELAKSIKRFKCDICSKTFKHRKNKVDHEQRHADKKNFVCDSCGSKFKTKKDVLTHKLKIHGKQKFECGSCHQTFPSFPYARRHVKVHTEVPNYQCSLCNETFRIIRTAKTHVEKSHSQSWKGLINTVNAGHFEELEKSLVLKVDEPEEEPIEPQCDECDGESSMEAAIGHLVRVLSDKDFSIPQVQNKQVCPICCKTVPMSNKSSSVRVHFKAHLKEAHDKITHCQQCKCTFASVAEYFGHLKDHYQRAEKYQCKDCDKKFMSKPDVVRHIFRVHSTEPCYKCSLCPVRLKMPEAVKKHCDSQHSGDGSYEKVDNEYTKNLLNSLTVIIDNNPAFKAKSEEPFVKPELVLDPIKSEDDESTESRDPQDYSCPVCGVNDGTVVGQALFSNNIFLKHSDFAW